MTDSPLLSAIMGIGELVDTPRRATWKALSGKEYGEQVTGEPISGFLLDAILNPMNLGLLPAALHKSLGKVAQKLGPRYGGNLREKIEGAFMPEGLAKLLTSESPDEAAAIRGLWKQSKEGKAADRLVERLTTVDTPYPTPDEPPVFISDKAAQAISDEIPPGTRYLGHGAEAVAFRTPQGDVIRIEPPGSPIRLTHGIPPPRPNIPGVLQPTRSIGTEGGRIERLPYAPTTSSSTLPGGKATKGPIELISDDQTTSQIMRQRHISPETYYSSEERVFHDLAPTGYMPTDIHQGNIGFTKEGRPIIIDPGAVEEKIGVPEPIKRMVLARAKGANADVDRVIESLSRVVTERDADRLADAIAVELRGQHVPIDDLVDAEGRFPIERLGKAGPPMGVPPEISVPPGVGTLSDLLGYRRWLRERQIPQGGFPGRPKRVIALASLGPTGTAGRLLQRILSQGGPPEE